MSTLAIHGGHPIIDPQDSKFEWPRITKEVERVALKQLHDSISIYDNSGIFRDFERNFSNYHNRQFGLLSNSGTSSILAMFEAINLVAGDEVLCPVYTFHATVSPMMYLGAVPVFCDADGMGNISLEQIKTRISAKTKAVIVTHMWGTPVQDIEDIARYCKEEGLYLLEDCSHAHGAEINGSKVGSFGDIAAWSLQGQKIITGGEGGILLTNDQSLYNRALLHGHYNKRPQKEIDENDTMREFYLTGFGLKLRAHPIAIAIANQQFELIDDFLMTKRHNAERISASLSKYPFLKLPTLNEDFKPSFYAYGMQYLEDNAYGVSKTNFVEALQAEGLSEVDIPGSTGLLNKLPLFTHPEKVLARMYENMLPNQKNYPKAEEFYDKFLKIPIWAYDDEFSIVDAYIKGFVKVCDYMQETGGLS
ncbi:MAG: aminotransferase class V-fold PLP-dependent enzyme [bacterium]